MDIQHKNCQYTSTNPYNLINQKFPVRVYARLLCSDIEYKTLSINYSTTSKELIKILLSKFRMKHKDPNLFYLTMIIYTSKPDKPGLPIRNVIPLDDCVCPAQIQASYPHKDYLEFSLALKYGGFVKVYDGSLVSGTMYKSLLISDHTTADELIQLFLNYYDSNEEASKFALYEVCPQTGSERKLFGKEFPLKLLMEWPTQDLYFFELRRNNNEPSQRRKLPWIKHSSCANMAFKFDYEEEECIKTVKNGITKPRDQYEKYFYI